MGQTRLDASHFYLSLSTLWDTSLGLGMRNISSRNHPNKVYRFPQTDHYAPNNTEQLPKPLLPEGLKHVNRCESGITMFFWFAYCIPHTPFALPMLVNCDGASDGESCNGRVRIHSAAYIIQCHCGWSSISASQ